MSVFSTITVKISKTKTKRVTAGKKKARNLAAEEGILFRNVKTVHGCYLK